MANKQLGQKLKELRMNAGYTQKQICEKLEISQSTFSSWEIGKSEPDAITFLKLCEIYKVHDILHAFTQIHLFSEEDSEEQVILTLSNHEQELIKAYRSQPKIQQAVDRLLQIEQTKKDENQEELLFLFNSLSEVDKAYFIDSLYIAAEKNKSSARDHCENTLMDA